ncbi:MAG: type IVB secretion system protein IcmH/DotU, partial [Pseudomonadota bacterium]
MAEEAKQPFDPDATVRQPTAAITTDPEDTVRGPVFDPDATVNPAARATLEDPEATIRIPSPGKRAKKNPFAPHALPESLQANLAALGGVNPLIALANPLLGAVPQIRRALKHPDPARLRERLREQIEALETAAMSADIPDKANYVAVYALCALLDESAASTPWGRDWIENGLLRELRDATDGGEGFFRQLESLEADPDGNADLIELFYVCMALGFEGRYRGAADGRHELERLRGRVYALVSRRRPRPRDGLSERWRSALAPQPAAP